LTIASDRSKSEKQKKHLVWIYHAPSVSHCRLTSYSFIINTPPDTGNKQQPVINSDGQAPTHFKSRVASKHVRDTDTVGDAGSIMWLG